MADRIISRSEARAQGLKRYFTGRPCKHGHASERRVGDGGCIACRDQWHRSHSGQMRVHRCKLAADNKDRDRLAKSNWRAANRGKQKAASERWAKANRARVLARQTKWLKADPERNRAKVSRRRARIAGANGTHTAADLAAILVGQSYRCVYCDADLHKIKRHVDHIQPLSAGGSNDPSNLQYLCEPCNLLKGAKHPVIFAQELGRMIKQERTW